MEYLNLGDTGLKVSRICLGCMSYGSPKWRDWVLDDEAAKPFFKRALDVGINFFDTADMYSDGESEVVSGRALKELGVRARQSSWRPRCTTPWARTRISAGCRASTSCTRSTIACSASALDYVDLYQIHRFDRHTPIEETLEALTMWSRPARRSMSAPRRCTPGSSRKLLHVPTQWLSRFVTHAEPLQPGVPRGRTGDDSAVPRGRHRPHSLEPARARFPGRQSHQAQLGRDHAGEERRLRPRLYYEETDFEVVNAFREVATARGVPNAQVALAWLLQQPGVTAPIVGATKMQHLEDAVAALSVKLTGEELQSLTEPYKPHPVLGNLS